MIDQKILNAFYNVQNKPILTSRTDNKEDWVLLFRYYNQNLEPGQQQVGMNCGPCYPKVLGFVKNKIEAEVSELKSNEFRSQNIV
jgi:hypothetical protein